MRTCGLFLAVSDGATVGRIAAIDDRHHKARITTTSPHLVSSRRTATPAARALLASRRAMGASSTDAPQCAVRSTRR